MAKLNKNLVEAVKNDKADTAKDTLDREENFVLLLFKANNVKLFWLIVKQISLQFSSWR